MTSPYSARDAAKVLATAKRLLADDDMSPQRRANLEEKARYAADYLDSHHACRHCGASLELADSRSRKAGRTCAGKASAA